MDPKPRRNWREWNCCKEAEKHAKSIPATPTDEVQTLAHAKRVIREAEETHGSLKLQNL